MDDGERRIRTHWTLRERYHRVAVIAAVLGGVLVMTPLSLLVAEGGVAALASPRFLVISLLVLAAGILIPHQLVLSVGRRQWRRAR